MTDGDEWTIPAPGEWTDQARCVGLGDIFTASHKPAPDELSVLERVCRKCPVAAECATYAREWPVVGWWSSRWYTEAERFAAARHVA